MPGIKMQIKFWQYALALMVCVWISCTTSIEEVICSEWKQISCYPDFIRVHDVIYGQVVGRNECNTQPTTNCTDPNGFCKVAKESEGKTSKSLHSRSSRLTPLPCRGGNNIYIIVDYSCLKKPSLSGEENFALKKPAKQSQTYSKDVTVASNAVDGETDQYYTSCTRTNTETTPWWRVDLEQRIAVTRVKILNRDYSDERLCGFEIRIGDSLANNGTTNARCGTQQYIPKTEDGGVVSCESPLVGRYVTIVIPGEKKILALCEVQVYGTGVLGNQSLTDLQLVGSNLPYEGHVILNGTTFCDPMWSMNDADVTCIQLGYPGIDVGHWNNSHFGISDSLPERRSLERRYNCSGTEGSLKECPKTVDREKTCEKQNAVSVMCQPYIRLYGLNVPLEGRLEVFHRGIWGTVCSYNSESFAKSATVACRELGFHDVVLNDRWKTPRATGKIWLKGLKCKGDEKSLVFCPHAPWNDASCSNHYRDIYVKCCICSDGLLQDSNILPDSVFNASASRSPNFLPSSARLSNSRPWCLPDDHLDENQFLEISLPGIFSLSAVATVGGNLGYVTSYMMSYVVSGYSWKYATVGKQKLILGNTNNGTHNVIRRNLDSTIHAEKVKFIPKTWQGVPCMRVELCGREIPRCNPPNITFENLTSNSVRISWLPQRLPGKTMILYNKNYSVTVTREKDQVLQFTNDTEMTFLFIKNLLPYRRYTYTVKAIGLAECFEEDVMSYFQTEQAAPNAPPDNIRVVDLDSTSVTMKWSPPPVDQQNGKITGYQLCYFTGMTNCSDRDASHMELKKTSVEIKELLPATVYHFRIRAKTEAGAGPYSEIRKIVTSSGKLSKSEDVNTTAYSFGFQLQQLREGFSYVQIIVIKLENKKLPNAPHTYTSDNISVVNESVPILKPYVTAQLSAVEANKLKNFVVGDGVNYGQSPNRRRRETEWLTRRYDEDRERRVTRSAKTTLFYNRPLEPDLFYSVFQRTFMDKETYYSSSWLEPVRTSMTNTGTSGEMSGDSGTGTWIGVGVGAVVVIILIVILILYFWKRRKQRLSKSNSGVQIIKNTQENDRHFNAETEYDNYDTIQCVAMDNLGDDDRDTDSETDAAGENVESADLIYGNAKVTETRDPHRMVPAEEFEIYVQDMKKNENFGFDHQFKELPQGICYPCTIAKSPENKIKNRYANIVSYDGALVTLSGGETYINASYIPGIESKSYIATQGPTAKTISTFWKMVWEQESSVIVMLTNLKEKEKAKCSKYWTESTKRFGNIILTFEEKELFPYYLIRKFVIEKDEVKRHVTQFHFTAWPDHGVPKYPTQLVAFQHAIRSTALHEMTGPVIVHCSAGVGRTGTYIVIDHCIASLSRQNERSVDVFHFVQEMRKCRVNMIQTLEQYILVHEAVLEFILCGFNELEGYALENTVEKLKKPDSKTKQTGFSELFQRLTSLSPVLTKEECRTATLKRNSCKNRTVEICPADFARVALSSSLSMNGSDYINATYVDGFQQKNAYIATESPLANTFDDFWQMIYEQRSPLVIMLNNCKEGREKYPEYFPTEKGYSTKYGNLFVRLDEHVADKAIVFRKFAISLTSDFESPSVVRHFQFTQWPKRGVPEKKNEILQLIHTVQTAQRQNDQGPMVVHCGNGAGRTGTFLTISICMERLKVEHSVDVFQCIKLIREHRPQFVENEHQLQFCYEVLAKFIETFEGYSNFLATD